MPPGHTVGTKKDTIFVGLGGSGFVPIQPAAADLAFVEALAALPASGGVLYVTPGTNPYVFQSAVVVSKPDVRIEFMGGPSSTGATPTSYLAFPSSGGPKQLFRIEARGFRCRGASVVHVASNVSGADDGRSCFLAQAVDDVRFEACRFDLKQDSGGIVGFTALRADGASRAVPAAGFRVSDCSFVIRTGTELNAPSGALDPRGIVCIRATNVLQAQILDCLVRGVSPVPARDTHCGSVVYLDNCPGSILTDVSIRFIDLGSALASKAADSAVRITTHAGAEGHRSVLARVLFEDVGTRSAIELTDARSDVIAYANFGRIIFVSESAIEANGSASRAVAVHGVNFHNVSASGLVPPPATNHMVDLRAARDVTIAGNVFSPFDDKQRFLRTLPGQCSGVAVDPTMSHRAK